MKTFFTKRKSNTTVKETVFSCKRENLTVRGTEYRPEGENLPIAIVSHGFMAFQDTVRQYAKVVNMTYIERAYEVYLKNKHKNNTKSNISLKIIPNGGHSFSKKHDVIAIQYLKEFFAPDK